MSDVYSQGQSRVDIVGAIVAVVLLSWAPNYMFLDGANFF